MVKRGLALAALAAGLAVGGTAQARDLVVVSWGGAYQKAQQEQMFKPFTTATGVKMKDEDWNGGVGTLRAKSQGEGTWDVVQVEADELDIGCEEGLYEKLDWAALGGKDKFLPAATHDCGVGAIVWSTAIAYDKAKLASGPASWADFWDVQKFPGKRSLRKGAKYTLEFALLADGVKAEDVYKTLATPAGVDRAFAKLDKLKPHIVWWEAGAQPPQLLASGEVVMTSAYNGRIASANKEGKNFGIVWPGSIYAVDSWVIMKNSPNKADSVKFLQYATKPDVQAKIPPFVPYGTTHKDAASMVDATTAAQLPTTPANLTGAIALDSGFWVANQDKLTERFNAWIAK